MQLDRTHVVVRVRTLSEIGDLAMVMIRRYPSSLLIGFVAGAVIWAIANAVLLSWLPLRELQYGLEDPGAQGEITRYLCWMTTLVVLQTPAAGVLTTYFLGQAVFEHRPTWRGVFREIRRQFKRWFWALGVGRLAIPALAIVALRYGQPASVFGDFFVPLGFLLVAAVMRSSRPFLPEILLLEQCPYRPTAEASITVSRRSKALHSPITGDLSGRFLATAFILFFLLMSLYYTLFWARGIATGMWTHDAVCLLVFFPLSLWAVAGVSVIVRLLSYLDTRIRLEGWEVELALRAEALRQFPDEAGPWLRRINGEATA